MTETADVRTSAMQMHSALSLEETERLTADIVAALKTVFDPEIPADIYELGLIYKVEITNDDADHAELSGGRRVADHGGERDRQRSRGRCGQCQPGVGARMVARPDERRSPSRAEYVVKFGLTGFVEQCAALIGRRE